MVENSILGSRIAKLRKDRGLTQMQFAKYLGKATSTIAMWETNNREPAQQHIIKIAKFFGVSVDYLMGMNYEMPTGYETLDPENRSDAFIAYSGGPKDILTEDETAFLKQQLEMFRAFKEKTQKEKGKTKWPEGQ